MKKKIFCFAITILCVIFSGVLDAGNVRAEVGITDDSIKFGTFQDMSGPGAYLGKQCTAALAVWRDWVNDDLGGIHGRKVDFVVEDNKYDPVLTKTAFTKLVNQHKVFAIISVYGSTPCTAILEDIKREKIPVFPGITHDTGRRQDIRPPFHSMATLQDNRPGHSGILS